MIFDQFQETTLQKARIEDTRLHNMWIFVDR